jgi:hypothetical protein
MHAAVHAPAIYAAQAAFAGLRAAIRGGQLLVQTGFAAGLAYFAQLSARNSPDRRAVLAFRARAFPGADGELVLQGIRELTAEEVGEVCEAYGTVQGKTNEAVLLAGPKGGRSPTVYGTHVHYELQELIKALGNPNLKAEQSVLKRIEETGYGSPGSIRIDVFEFAKNKTVCVYDIKTGEGRRSGLSPSRMFEIAYKIFKAYGPEFQLIIVTEVRPTVPRQ